MVTTILAAISQIKADLAVLLEATVIERICRDLKYTWRDRLLSPVVTVHGFLLQVLHGNTACDHVPHLLGGSFTGEAYCRARSRLPLELFTRLLAGVIETLGSTREQAERWFGHQVWLLDGSSASMPDTPELQNEFGQPGAQKPGCGFPVAHLLTLFHAGTGMLQKIVAAPLRTHDMKDAFQMHLELRAGDVLVADRGFCSYAHLAKLQISGLFGVFRLHQRIIASFRKGRLHIPPRRCFGGVFKGVTGLPRSRWVRWLGRLDQVVEYYKPTTRPQWISAEDYAALPESILVRELRFQISIPGCRTKEVILVTNLIDAERYPAAELAQLYYERWQVEVNLRHLKQTLHLDVLRCKTADGVRKELCMIALLYNLVRLVMCAAADRQNVPPDRISFIDALRWLNHARPGEPLSDLLVIPIRPRIEPRARKRRPKNYGLMTQPRTVLRKALCAKG